MQNHIQKNNKKNNSTLNILFEDSDIIVCEKPHGTATQSRRIGSPDMVNLIKRHIYEAAPDKGEPYLAVIHRLDQPVRGILVFAKTPAAAKDLSHQLQNGDFGKYYLALTDGIPADASGTLENYLYKNPQTSTASVCDAKKKGAKKARLSYEIHNELRNFFLDTASTDSEDIFFSKNHANTGDRHAADIQDSSANTADDPTSGIRDISSNSTSVDNRQSTQTLLKIHLDTGRFHQIRCQLAAIGCPIVGDTKYNPDCRTQKGWQTLCLCAYKLEFTHPVTHKKMKFSLLS